MSMWLGWTFLAIVAVEAVTGQIDETAPVMGEVGKSVVIPCPYKLTENELLFTLGWKKGDEDIQVFVRNEEIYKGNFTRMLVNNNTGELTLVNIQFDDAGVYSCSVLTSKGSSTQIENLQVFAAPEVNARVLPVVLQEDFQSHRKKENLAECRAVGGSPPFSIKWVTSPGSDLIIGDSFRTESVNRDNKELVDATLLLTILPDPIRNDGKMFSCVVEDAMGSETVHEVIADVSVLTTPPPSTTMQASPTVVSFPAKDGVPIYAQIGERKNFTCEVTGVPSPNVIWYSGARKITEGVGKAILEIDIETLDNAGHYTCKGNNKEGEDSDSFQLIIRGAPVILNENDVTNGTNTIASNSEEEFVNISCQASAFPIADIRWEIEGRNITNAMIDTTKISNKNIVISTARLRLFDKNEKKKRVRCIATNSLGQSIKTFIVTNPDTSSADLRLVVGVIIGVVVILALAIIILCLVLSSRRHQNANVTVHENAENDCLSCKRVTVCSRGKKPDNKTREESCEQVREVTEEGTKEEKMKLTCPEEQGSANENESSHNGSSNENAVEVVKPHKSRFSFHGLQCCQSNKKILKEDEADEQETTKSKDKEENKDSPRKKTEDSPTKPDPEEVQASGKVAEESKS